MADTALVPIQQPFIRKRLPDAASHLSLAPGQAEALAGIAHDARNLVTALKLCMELIGEPGVLTEPHAHYVEEVRSITRAAEHLMRRLSAVARTSTLSCNSPAVHAPIRDLAASIHELAGLLSAVAGHTVQVQVACLPCAGTLALSEENLTRILLNLVRNAADAMPTGGHIRITAQRGGGQSFLWTLRPGTDDTCGDFDIEAPADGPQTVVLSVEDDGPGISADLAERIFAPGFSTRRDNQPWPDAPHHGLGLSIVRQLVEEAGGTVRLAAGRQRGARFELELPLTNVMPSLLSAPVAIRENDAQ